MNNDNKSLFDFTLKKKGLSPVIAVVLLVALSFILMTSVFVWARGFIFEQIEVNGKPVEQVCSEISFDFDEGIYEGGVLSIQVVNRGNVEIYGFDIKFIKEGDAVTKKFDFVVPIAGSSDVQNINIEEGATKLIMYPRVMGSVRGKKVSKPVSCVHSGKTIALGNLEEL